MTSFVDILPDHLAIVQGVLRASLPPHAVIWVFGSRAGRRARKKFSDLDLAVDAGRALTLKERAGLYEDFDESSLPYKVDIVDMHSASPEFKRIIEQARVPLPM